MFSGMKTRERRIARAMRRDGGRSIKEIARRVGVSSSSVSLWVRDIELSEEQHAALAARNRLHYRQVLARAAMSEKARERRREWQRRGRRLAQIGEPDYVAGCMLGRGITDTQQSRLHQLRSRNGAILRLFRAPIIRAAARRLPRHLQSVCGSRGATT
jgi:transposase-like protein